MPFDGSVTALSIGIAKFLTIRKGDQCFKEIVNVEGEYVQCVMCLDNGRLLIVERDGFDMQQQISSDDYGLWRIVLETLDDGIKQSLIENLLF